MPSSDFTITLNESKDYQRCALFIHALAFVVLINSALPVTVIILLSAILSALLLRIFLSRIPLPMYRKLSYHPGYWLLHTAGGEEIKYESATIGFEGGLFILLTLTGINPKKHLVIFSDQMTIAQYRVLKIMTKNGRARASKGDSGK